MDRGIAETTKFFDERFEKIFPVPSNYPTENLVELKEFSKAITSNLLGGVGYFYGKSLVDRGFAHEWDQEDDRDDEHAPSGPQLTEARALLTATPSRSFFPRGFYWYDHGLDCGCQNN